MGEVIYIKDYLKRKRRESQGDTIIPFRMAETPSNKEEGWRSHEEMLESALADLDNNLVVRPYGCAIVFYHPEFTTIYRRKLSYKDIHTITHDFITDADRVQKFDPEHPGTKP